MKTYKTVTTPREVEDCCASCAEVLRKAVEDAGFKVSTGEKAYIG